MSEKYPLQETLSPIDKIGRDRLNENWTRIMAYFDHVQLQIKALAGGQEVDELIARLEQAIVNAETDLQNYIAQVDSTVQEAINANNTATQDAIAENNTALQIALGKVADKLLEVNQAIEDAEISAEGANVAKQGALDATAQAKTAITDMQSLINNTVHRGIWNNTTQYFKNNMATYNGSAFIALQDNVDKTPPTLPTQSNAYWTLFAEKGATGATGPQGLPGKDGKDGTGVNIIGSLASEADLPQTGSPGDAYMIGGDLYVWQENLNNWKNVGPIQGPEGKSAYDLAVQNGFVGTMEEWLESLKGEVGPQGPQGEQGPPGQDADLTEVNQEIANIKQTVSDNKTEVTEHLAQMATTQKAGHVMLVNDLTTGGADKAASAETVKVLKTEIDKLGTPNANGTVKINDNHAIRYFNFNAWSNNTYSEHLRVHFPKVPFSGQMKLRLASGYTGEIVGGGSEFLYNISYVPDTEMLLQSFDILQTGVGVSAGFRVWQMGLRPVGDRRPYLTITKKRIKAPIYYELEIITSSNNAFEVLDAVSPENDSSSTSADTADEQQSIFTHVGNSKKNLATAITGKGVTTSADATFAQMVANINAIPTGTKKVIGTTKSSSVGVSFKYSGSTATINLPYVDITLDFEPSTIYLYFRDHTENSDYTSVYNRYQEYYLDPVKVSRHNGSSVTNNNFEVEVIKLSPTVFRMPVSKINVNTYWTAYQ